jgi:hypothetical protein
VDKIPPCGDPMCHCSANTPPEESGYPTGIQVVTGGVRLFDTGASRDTEEGKPDYEGYLSPLVIERFGQYMVKHQIQSDGTYRPGDNWQKGIPFKVYMKSGWRHFMDWWSLHRDGSSLEPSSPSGVNLTEEALCALMFNVMGYLHELLKRKRV